MKGNNKMEATQSYKVQRQILDGDSFEKVTLVKSFDFSPASTIEEAMQRLGGDTKKFLEVVNEGLVSAVREQMKADSTGWGVENSDGDVEPWNGSAIDDSQFNALVLSMAKASFKYFDAKTPEEKKASKAKAAQVIKSTPILLEGLKA
jgi:hypothetical protein